MTWQHFLRAMMVALLGAAALAVASQARAEGNVISPDEAEALVKAHIEADKAAEAALAQEEAEAKAAEEANAKKAGRTAKGSEKKSKEATAAPKDKPTAQAKADASVAKAKGGAEADLVEETASLPASEVVLKPAGRTRQSDAVRAAALKPMIARYASENGLPYELADAVVRLESRYNAGARNGPNMGLTQINFRTAQSLGYKGDSAGLLDAETNLRYGLKYLAQAYKLANGDTCGTILRYQFGHRTTTMTGASRAYCAKVKVITAAAE